MRVSCAPFHRKKVDTWMRGFPPQNKAFSDATQKIATRFSHCATEKMRIPCASRRPKFPATFLATRNEERCKVLGYTFNYVMIYYDLIYRFYASLTSSVLGSQVGTAKVWPQRGRGGRWHSGSAMQPRRNYTAHGRTAERARHSRLRDKLGTQLPPRRPPSGGS